MIKGTLFTSAKFSSIYAADAIHLRNIYESLSYFSEVNVCYPSVNVRVIGPALYLAEAHLATVFSSLDYAWVRGSYSAIMLRILRARGIISIYDIAGLIVKERELYGKNRFMTKVAAKNELESLVNADIVRVHNSRLKNYLLNKYSEQIPTLSQKIAVIPIPINLSKFHPKEKFDFANPQLIYTGGATKWQGLEQLVTAFSMLNTHDVNLTLYIKAIPENIRKIIRDSKLGDSVQQRFVSHGELIAALPMYDVFVIPRPSHIITEIATPMKLIEAMACGMPIVATDVGGINEYVKHKKTGYLVEPGNPKALAEGIREMIGNPKLAQEMGRNARKFAQKTFDYKIIAKQINRCLDETLKDTHTS